MNLGVGAEIILFRAVVAGLTAFVISLVTGKIFIGIQRKHAIGQTIREDGPETHLKKGGTPTVGGIFFILAILVSTLLWVRSFRIVVISLTALAGFGVIGLWDDLLKLYRANSEGLKAKYKIALQVILAYLLLFELDIFSLLKTAVYIPWSDTLYIPFGSWYYLFAILYIVLMVNACNLADGLDGLATGLGIISFAAMIVFGFISVTGSLHTSVGEFMGDDRIELIVFLSSMIGGLLGFLWYNAGPAQVFMGDTGSMAIGGVFSMIAIITQNEILMLFIGAVFIMEALSVIIQVSSYKIRQKRVFLMAPIHHHFEKMGWKEVKVVHRFWIFSMICVLIGLLIALRM